jgi:hypothetical protein
VDDQTGTELRLKPGGLRRHDVAGVGNKHKLLHRHGVEGKSHLHFAGVDAAFQFAKPTYATHEVDALVGAEVGYAKYVAQDEVARYGDIKSANRVGIVVAPVARCEAVPMSGKVEREVVQSRRAVFIGAFIFYNEVLCQAESPLRSRTTRL